MRGFRPASAAHHVLLFSAQLYNCRGIWYIVGMVYRSGQQYFDGQPDSHPLHQADTFCPVGQFKESGVYHHLAATDHPSICDFIPGYAFYCFIGR